MIEFMIGALVGSFLAVLFMSFRSIRMLDQMNHHFMEYIVSAEQLTDELLRQVDEESDRERK